MCSTTRDRAGFARTLVFALALGWYLSVLCAAPVQAGPLFRLQDPVLVGGSIPLEVRDVSGVSRFVDVSFVGQATGIVAGDVNGDGMDEAVIELAGSGELEIRDPYGFVLDRFSVGPFRLVATGDVLGDTADEILVSTATGIDVYDDSGTRLSGFALAGVERLAAGDVNGDGSDEIVVAGPSGGAVEIFGASGAMLGSFDPGLDVSLTGDLLGTGDVDGDDLDDIVVVRPLPTKRW